MRVYEELVCLEIGKRILNTLQFCKEEFIEETDTIAIKIIEDIRKILISDLSDCEKVEKILSVFENNNISY